MTHSVDVLIPLTVGEVIQPAPQVNPPSHLSVLIPLTVGEVIQLIIDTAGEVVTTVLIPLTVGEVIQLRYFQVSMEQRKS